MGWTSFNLNQPVKEWFSENWNQTGKHEILDVAIVKRNTLYAAIKYKDSGEVFAVIYLLRYAPKSYYNFSYKDMDETCGPYEFECPERIIKLLSPTTNEYALQWRERVRMYHKTKKIINTKDTVIKFYDSIEFTGGGKYNVFKKINKKIYAGYINNNKFESLTRVNFNIVRRMLNSKYEYVCSF